MPNWKEEFDKDFGDRTVDETVPYRLVKFNNFMMYPEIKVFIETEVIEKLIEDIRGHKCRCHCPENKRLDEVIQDLRSRWLSKGN